MSQTAPPERDMTSGSSDREDAASTSPPSRDWKQAVSNVTSSVADVAADAVTVVNDAARSLTSRARGELEPPPTSTRRSDSNGYARDDALVASGNGQGTSANGDKGGIGRATVALRTETRRATTALKQRPPRQAPPRRDMQPAPQAHQRVGESAPWSLRPGSDRRETAWLPPLRERTTEERPWLVRAAAFAAATLAGLAAVFVVAVALLPRVFGYAATAADAELILPDDTAFDSLAQRSRVYAADGSLLAILHGEEDRNPVSLKKMPDHMWQAVVAEEDRKFFEHDGYDLTGIARAALANLEAGGVEQGGSTISQQVARMNFEEVGLEQSIERKFKEVVYAMALERKFEKEEILDRYLNQVYFGAGAYGVQAASEEFFDKNVADITVDEAALLSALISSPSSYNPRVNPEAARAQRNHVLLSMANVGYISKSEAAKYTKAELQIAPPSDGTLRQPSIIEAVMREIKRNPLFGATEQEREDNLFNGGLRITTTIDPELQKLAEDVVEDNFSDDGPTAAIGSVDPLTGAIKAAASSKKYNNDNFNLALQGRRQPGSAFKPFVMAEALRQGFSPGTTLSGKSPLLIPMPGEDWAIENFGGASYGNMDMRTATMKSVNTYYAQLIELVGADKTIEMAERMGINGKAAFGDDVNPSIVLGGLTYGVTPVEMASAYGTFANNGVHIEPYLIAEVKRGGEDILKREAQKTQVLDPAVNAVAVDLLRGTVSGGGTAPIAALPNFPVAGKTGTAQNGWDAWFVGTTPVLSTAVWVGHPEGQIVMYGATGGRFAAPSWKEFMSAALADVEPTDFPEADEAEFVGKTVNVPDVAGMGSTEALAELAEVKLIGAIQGQPSDAPVGTVIWVSPSDQAQVGTTVYVGVSTGQPEPPPQPEPEEPPENDDDDGNGGGPGNGNGRGIGEAAREQLEELVQPRGD